VEGLNATNNQQLLKISEQKTEMVA